MSTREDFVQRFGEDQAVALEAAANEHENGLHPNQGSDPFKWVLMLVISYECAPKDSYREYHGISAPWVEVRRWIIDHGDLGSHDGDVDMLALFTGAYNEFIPEKTN